MLLIKLIIRLYYQEFKGRVVINYSPKNISSVDVEEKNMDLFDSPRMEGIDYTFDWFLSQCRNK